MELIILVAALAVLSVLARFFGCDSREAAPSKEEELARLGITCDQAETATPRAEHGLWRGLANWTRGSIPSEGWAWPQKRNRVRAAVPVAVVGPDPGR
jgi:hypothetical protein